MAISWYEGEVTAAVAEAKTKQASLMIFVTSDDEFTPMYQKILYSLDFTKKNYIAIRLVAYTEAYEQLKAIYRIVPVPSILVIDWESGMVMERVAGAIFDEELQEALLDAITDLPKTEEPKPKEPSLPPVQEIIVEKPQQVKIQLKMPSGETKTQVYQPNDKLENLRKDVKVLFNLNTSFELAVPYPRRPLTRDQDDLTLVDLSLSPASTVLVLPEPEGSLLPWCIFASFWKIVHCIVACVQGWWHQWFPPSSQNTADEKKKN